MRYVFTISPGRSGQASLSAILASVVPDAFVAFEEPQVRPLMPGPAGDLERRFRRRFIETDELLGRGRVLTAFDAGDTAALDRFAQARHRWVKRRLRARGKSVYIDVSKHFLHGLHELTLALVEAEGDYPRFIRLVRNPIENMRSYLNRRKRFHLDYGATDGPRNELRMAPDSLGDGERYLHAWCETYLRGERLLREHALGPAVEIETGALSDPAAVAALLNALELPHLPIPEAPPHNTNVDAGYGPTQVRQDDVDAFLRFRDRLPEAIASRLPDVFASAEAGFSTGTEADGAGCTGGG